MTNRLDVKSQTDVVGFSEDFHAFIVIYFQNHHALDGEFDGFGDFIFGSAQNNRDFLRPDTGFRYSRCYEAEGLTHSSFAIGFMSLSLVATKKSAHLERVVVIYPSGLFWEVKIGAGGRRGD